MTFHSMLLTRIQAMAEAKVPASEITAPLVAALAHVLVATSRSHSSDPAVQRSSLHGMVEIVRNELDEAVAHYDKELAR